MAQIGTFVQATEIPAAATTAYDVATAFVVGEADWGPVGQVVPLSSLTNVAGTIGSPAGTGSPYSSRTATCATSFDALETLLSEGGYRALFSRVVGSAAVAAAHTFLDGSGSPALTVTAAYVGAGGNALYVAMTKTSSTYVISVQDVLGNVLAQSPSLSNNASGVTWLATTGLATGSAGAGGIPATVSATALSGGTDDRTHANLGSWQTALGSFYAGLGPGQVFAPGMTNTSLSGIWSTLGLHAQANNRVALLDMDDGQTAGTLKTDVVGFASGATASYCGFWAGDLTIPGAVVGSTRSVSPSAAIAGLCARVDPFGSGNVNQAAAGVNWPLQFASKNTSAISGSGGAIYSPDDLYTLNDSGVNSFAVVQGQFLNYGFVSAVLPTTDAIYWQLSASRTRMSIIADAQIVGQPYVFSQVDGGGGDAAAFAGDLTNMLTGYYNRGALYGQSASDAFTVDTGPTVNTSQTIQAGQLNARVQVRISPFAEKVTININANPITTTLPPVNTGG